MEHEACKKDHSLYYDYDSSKVFLSAFRKMKQVGNPEEEETSIRLLTTAHEASPSPHVVHAPVHVPLISCGQVRSGEVTALVIIELDLQVCHTRKVYLECVASIVNVLSIQGLRVLQKLYFKT